MLEGDLIGVQNPELRCATRKVKRGQTVWHGNSVLSVKNIKTDALVLSSQFNELVSNWAPAFAGVATFYEFIKLKTPSFIL
jgi:hypothetical protein